MKKIDRPIRTSFCQGEIIADVCVPDHQTGNVAILAGGLPSSPSKDSVLQFLKKQGYVAIAFRYRGTWESKGYFLQHTPSKDIDDIINDIKGNRCFKNIFSGKEVKIQVRAITLFGSSFGGPAVLFNASNPLIKKVIALSPVLDWQALEKSDEPFHIFLSFIHQAFPGAYRVRSPRDWQKLLHPDFYNPIDNVSSIDFRKVFILHAHDDTIVPYTSLESLARTGGIQYYMKPHGGHFSISDIASLFLWKKIQAFVRK